MLTRISSLNKLVFLCLKTSFFVNPIFKGRENGLKKKLKIDSISELIQFISAIDKTQNELYELSKPLINKECQNEYRKCENRN
jgi:hypothetical protein